MKPAVVTTSQEFASRAADLSPGTRLPVLVRAAVEDPFEAYRRARSPVGGVYLATTGGQAGWGYFGVDPQEYCSVDPADPRPSTLASLQSFLADESISREGCPVPYPAGVIGWLSYDIAREIESLPATTERDRDLPRLQVARYETLAAWEEPRDEHSGPVTLSLTSCPRVEEPDDPEAVQAVYERGREQALGLARRVQEGNPEVEEPPVQRDSAQFESECGPSTFADRVRTVKSHVRDGDTFQANVSQRLRAPAAVHPVCVFDALRTVNPAPYSALIEFPGVDLVSASPELLLKREGERIRTEPIAGTRPRGETDVEDARLERDLRTDAKERAEHAMLVDLERNDLGKVCQYGTVEVTEYRRVDRYAEVMHLVSDVEGRLRPGQSLTNVIEAVFPGGTITGAPKPRTMKIIDEVERSRRGPYTGSIGIFGFDNRATMNIIIRTLVRYDQEYFLRVGAGIVHDSVPQQEYAETLDKGRALVTAVDQALGERVKLSIDQP